MTAPRLGFCQFKKGAIPKQDQHVILPHRYATDGDSTRTKNQGLGASSGCAAAWHSCSVLPAMGRFVIRVGMAVTCVASLTCPDGTFDNAYVVSRMILLHFKSKDFEEDF